MPNRIGLLEVKRNDGIMLICKGRKGMVDTCSNNRLLLGTDPLVTL